MRIYKREKYLKRIRGFYHDTGLIKVISGIRRCGKSCLMMSIIDELLESGVRDDNIIFINLDKRGYKNIKTPAELEKVIDEKSAKTGTIYLFIDEIQNISGFEESVNAYREEGRYSVFITGSNSYLLSGELITKLTGRYIEFQMFPLTFDEYIGMKKFMNIPVDQNITVEFDSFVLEGGFPKALEYSDPEDKRAYVESVIREILEKDIRRRVKIRNIADFEKTARYIINNFGATTNLTNILNDLHKDGSRIKRETLGRYIQTLIDAKILYRCDRFDMKSRKSISGEQKYYLADLGFYFATNVDNRINYGPALENITYVYARSNGYSVSVGRIGKLECDFIVRSRANDYSYIQVAMSIMGSRETEDREYAPLEKIKDNYPKFVLTRNDLLQKRNGIIHDNIPEFMSRNESFT